MEVDDVEPAPSSSASISGEQAPVIAQQVQEQAQPEKMEAEVGAGVQENVMASSNVTTAIISVSLHPLVIMNVSEHWTRLRAQENAPQQVVGALIGKQKGRNIEIMNSFELNFHKIEGAIVIDKDYYVNKEEQFKQVFPELDFLGWYTTGDGDVPNISDMNVHKQIVDIIESPLLLKLHPMTRHTGLPIKLYESVIDVVNGVATMLFVDIPYNLATEEAERIGLDHMARMTSTSQSDTSNSLAAEHLRVQHSAVKMLRDRVKLILDYVKATQEKTVPWNHEILRDIHNLCHRLPLIASDQFSEDFYHQCNDVALMANLGMLTKGCDTMNQFVNKFNILYDRQGMGRRMRGIFF